jgi:hypothetical protein
MVINFKTCGISRGTCKMTRIITLIIIKKKLNAVCFLYYHFVLKSKSCNIKSFMDILNFRY